MSATLAGIALPDKTFDTLLCIGDMGTSMADYLRQDMECEGLLECIHGLKELDREVYLTLINADGGLTVDEIADKVDRERSTAYRSIQRLVQNGLAQKEQINYQSGGYYHEFHPTDPDKVAEEMQRMLNDWYAKMGQLIQEYREKYNEAAEQAPDQ